MAPLKRDYMSNVKNLRYASRRGLAKKSLLPAYTEVFEHFELNRNPAHILAEQGHLYTF